MKRKEDYLMRMFDKWKRGKKIFNKRCGWFKVIRSDKGCDACDLGQWFCIGECEHFGRAQDHICIKCKPPNGRG
jgi:hypothetical protein